MCAGYRHFDYSGPVRAGGLFKPAAWGFTHDASVGHTPQPDLNRTPSSRVRSSTPAAACMQPPKVRPRPLLAARCVSFYQIVCLVSVVRGGTKAKDRLPHTRGSRASYGPCRSGGVITSQHLQRVTRRQTKCITESSSHTPPIVHTCGCLMHEISSHELGEALLRTWQPAHLYPPNPAH